MSFYRPTWAQIDLDALVHNFRQVKKIVGSKVKVMATVKADAYGHGIIPVSRTLDLNGIDYLGVASIDEGIVLRRAGINLPVLVLGTVLPNNLEPVFRYSLAQTVCTEELAVALDKSARKLRKKALIHIKVDTGMGRLGVWHEKALSFIKKTARLKNIVIEGIFTHFPLADSNAFFTEKQIEIFNSLIARLKKEGMSIALTHSANSMGIMGYKSSHFNMVRPGLMIYGIHPKNDLGVSLKPVLSLKTRVVFVNRLSKGRGISYGHEYITKKHTTIVNLPIGYGDGYPRNLSNIGPILIKGKRFKISGRVCMDQILVDVGGLKVKLGDEAVLIGSQGKERILADELAGMASTIPYEIVCGIGARVPRVYLGKADYKI